MVAFLVKTGCPRRKPHGTRQLFLSGVKLTLILIFFFRESSRTARLLRALDGSSSATIPHPQSTSGSVTRRTVSDENATESEYNSPLVTGHKSIGHGVVDGREKVTVF